eukprot:2019503-Pleurochrysis_carterae.AAC.1
MSGAAEVPARCWRGAGPTESVEIPTGSASASLQRERAHQTAACQFDGGTILYVIVSRHGHNAVDTSVGGGSFA